jgi:hypothetical protein
MKTIDLTNKTFGRLTVISRNKSIEQRKNRNVLWLCRCECETEITTRSQYLRNGITKSCGCLQKELTRKHKTRHGHAGKGKNGMSSTYLSWQSMKARCTNKSRSDYKNYGGRGIRICKRWMTFENFLTDMGDCPKGLTLDRIKNNQGYYPGNCKWSTQKEQARNKRSNRLITFNGETRCIAEWSQITGINKSTIQHRLKNHWSDEKALTK